MNRGNGTIHIYDTITSDQQEKYEKKKKRKKKRAGVAGSVSGKKASVRPQRVKSRSTF